MAQTYGEIVYLVMDQLKLSSDDTTLNEYHILSLLDKYRAFLLKQKYADLRKDVNHQNYQNIDVPIRNLALIDGVYISKSLNTVPRLLDIGITKVFTNEVFGTELFTYVDRNRFRYTGLNKYLKNIVYASILSDSYLYIRTQDEYYTEVNKVTLSGVFLTASQPYLLIDPNIDMLEQVFPLEDTLVNTLIEMVIKLLTPKVVAPLDNVNNENDDMNLANKQKDND